MNGMFFKCLHPSETLQKGSAVKENGREDGGEKHEMNDFVKRFSWCRVLGVSKVTILVFVLLSPVLVRFDAVAQSSQVSSGQDHECRLWGIIGQPSSILNDTIRDHLLGDPPNYDLWPHCLKRLGGSYHCQYCYNDDGWGLAMINSTSYEIRRGQISAWVDSHFGFNVTELLSYYPLAFVGHVRRASSGSPIPDSGDPHPFNRSIGMMPMSIQRLFLFGHNGGVDKTIVRDLIAGGNTPQDHKDYFDKNPDDRPTCYAGCDFGSLSACLYQTPIPNGHIVDSELYFVYLLKCIREATFNVPAGLSKAITSLTNAGAVETALNFFLLNAHINLATGEVFNVRLWGFRYYNSSANPNNYTLHYWIPKCSWCGVIASSIPGGNTAEWSLLNNGDLIELWMEDGSIKSEIHTIPSAVGGIIISVDKLGLLLRYISLVSTMIVATAATAVYIKRIKHRKEKR